MSQPSDGTGGQATVPMPMAQPQMAPPPPAPAPPEATAPQQPFVDSPPQQMAPPMAPPIAQYAPPQQPQYQSLQYAQPQQQLQYPQIPMATPQYQTPPQQPQYAQPQQQPQYAPPQPQYQMPMPSMMAPPMSQMGNALGGLDFSNVQSKNYRPLDPNVTYEFEIKTAEMQKSQNDNLMLVIGLETIFPVQQAGVSVTDYITLTDAALWRAKSLFKACNLLSQDGARYIGQSERDLVGYAVRANIRHDLYNGETRNKITGAFQEAFEAPNLSGGGGGAMAPQQGMVHPPHEQQPQYAQPQQQQQQYPTQQVYQVPAAPTQYQQPQQYQPQLPQMAPYQVPGAPTPNFGGQ